MSINLVTKNTYPNTESILILSDPGAASHFISKLLSNLYYGNEFIINENGDAHAFDATKYNVTKESRALATTGSMRPIFRSPYGNYAYVESNVLLLEPIDPSKPFIIKSHMNDINLIQYYKKFPLGKVIVITSNKKDFCRLTLNVFVKNIVSHYDDIDKSMLQTFWSYAKKQYSIIGDKDPGDLTVSEIHDLLKLYEEKFINTKGCLKFQDDQLFLPLHRDKTLLIPYRKILNDPNFIMSQLSSFVNRPINENTTKAYTKYVEAQISLIEKYAPWLPKYENN